MDLNVTTLKTAAANRSAAKQWLIGFINHAAEQGRVEAEFHIDQGKLLEDLLKEKGYTVEFFEDKASAIVRWGNNA